MYTDLPRRGSPPGYTNQAATHLPFRRFTRNLGPFQTRLETWLLNFSEPSSISWSSRYPGKNSYIYIYIYTRNSWPFAWYAIVYVYAWEIVLLELSLELLPFFLFFFLVFFGFAKRSICSLNNYYVKFVTWRISCKFSFFFVFRSLYVYVVSAVGKLERIIPDSEISSTVPCYSRHD